MYFSVIHVAGACRVCVISKYPRMFSTPLEAECHFSKHQSIQPVAGVRRSESSTVNVGTQTDASLLTISQANNILHSLPELNVLEFMFQTFGLTHYGVKVQPNFLGLCFDSAIDPMLCMRLPEELVRCGAINLTQDFQ